MSIDDSSHISLVREELFLSDALLQPTDDRNDAYEHWVLRTQPNLGRETGALRANTPYLNND